MTKNKETNKMHGWGCPIHDATGLPCYNKNMKHFLILNELNN